MTLCILFSNVDSRLKGPYNTAHHNERLTLVNKTKNISINFLEKYARTLDDAWILGN